MPVAQVFRVENIIGLENIKNPFSFFPPSGCSLALAAIGMCHRDGPKKAEQLNTH